MPSRVAIDIGGGFVDFVAVDEQTARKQNEKAGTYIESWRERVLQGIPIAGDADTISYILLGLVAENYPPDPATDALARFLKNRQSPDGRCSSRRSGSRRSRSPIAPW